MTTKSSAKRVLRERRYSGQEDAVIVVKWLNAHRTEHAARRIATLVSDLTALCTSVVPWEERTPPFEQIARWQAVKPRISLSEAFERGLIGEPNTWPTVTLGRNFSIKALHRAQAALSRYSFRPVLVGQRIVKTRHRGRLPVFARLYGEDIKPEFQKADRTFSVAMSPSRVGSRGRDDEFHAILHIISLTRNALIDRIRRCSCGTWFFAHNFKMSHHTERCRHRDYKSTPEWREKRNRYMRDYYRKFQSPNASKFQRKGK